MKRIGILAVGLLAASLLTSVWSPARQEAHGSPGDEMTVVGPEMRVTGDLFDVDVNISEADSGYWGYQAYLQWDDSVLAYVDVTYTGLGGMTLDAPPMLMPPDGVFFASSRPSPWSNDTGTAARVRLECIGTGTSLLHLVSLPEDPNYGTTLIWDVGPHTQLVDDEVTCLSDTDPDSDGCMSSEELPSAPSPKPGATGSYDALAWYDFYDVPVPVNPDPAANGPRNRAVTMSDVLAVLRYVNTKDGGLPNPNGVDYDSVKGSCDWNADTTPDKEGLCYDRSSGALPNPPWAAGPPDGAISMQDIMVVLPQMGLDCSAPP